MDVRSIKTLLIINPKAGRVTAQGYLFEIVNFFSQNNMEVTVMPTQRRGDATKIARSTASQYDLVVSVGGDGTLNEVVVGLMGIEHPPTLGIIPAGTTNDFASSLKIPTDAKKAAEVIVNGHLLSLDTGDFQNTNFMYSATFGFLTEVSYMTDQKQKNIFGRFAYLLEGAKRIWYKRSYELSMDYDGQHLEGSFAFGAITNTYSLAGIIKYESEQINLGDGLFEVLLIKDPANVSILRSIFFKLINKQVDKRFVYLFHAANIKISCSKSIHWSIDGEDGGSHREVFIRNRCRSIDIMCP